MKTDLTEKAVTTSRTVSLKERLGYGVGISAEAIGIYGIPVFINAVYNILLGVNPALIGLCQAIPRLWDAITDPFMGFISDHTRSRWGRRKPWVFSGAIMMGIFTTALWCIPGGFSTNGYFIYLMVIMLSLFTVHTVFMIPYYAWGCELSPDTNERSRIFAIRSLFVSGWYLINGWLFALSQSGLFGDGLAGMRVVGIIMGICVTITGVTTAIAVKERTVERPPQSAESLGFWKGYGVALCNKPLIIVISTNLVVSMGIYIVMPMQVYVNNYYVVPGNLAKTAEFSAWTGTIITVVQLVLLPIIPKFVEIFGKKRVYITSILFFGAGAGLRFFLYNPEYPYLQLLDPVFFATANAVSMIVNAAFIADVIDFDELETSERREGIFTATNGWIMKLSYALTALFSGFLLNLTGFERDAGIEQAGDAVLYIRLCFCIIPFLFSLIAVALFLRYTLTDDMVGQIRHRLEYRRGKLKVVDGH